LNGRLTLIQSHTWIRWFFAVVSGRIWLGQACTRESLCITEAFLIRTDVGFTGRSVLQLFDGYSGGCTLSPGPGIRCEGFAASSSFLPSLSKILVEFVTINMVLMLFNLIPLAPLDGEKILDYLLPPSMQSTFESIRPYGPMILIVVAVVLPYFALTSSERSCALLNAHDEFPGRLSGEGGVSCWTVLEGDDNSPGSNRD